MPNILPRAIATGNYFLNISKLPSVNAVYGIKDKGSRSGSSTSCRRNTTRCIAIQNSSKDNAPSLFISAKFLKKKQICIYC